MPPVESWLHLTLDARMPSAEGPAFPPEAQTSVAELPRAFFVMGPPCRTECDPSDFNPITFSEQVDAGPIRRCRLGSGHHGSDARAGRDPDKGGAWRRARYRVAARRRRCGLRPAAARSHVADRPERHPPVTTTARRLATRGSGSSRTGTSRRSRASAMAMASGRRTAARSSPSTRATSRPSRSAPSTWRQAI